MFKKATVLVSDFFEKVHELPLGLERFLLKMILVGIGSGVAFIAFSLYLHTTNILLGLLISFAFCLRGFSIPSLWEKGKIQEIAVVCVSVNKERFKKQMAVTFRTANEETPIYFTFSRPTTEYSNYESGRIYAIYICDNTPEQLLTCIAI